MTREFERHIEQLQDLNLEIRRRQERAEFEVERSEALLAQLAAANLLNDQIFLGDYLLHRPYSVQYEPGVSGQVVQAALALPGGPGAIFWDSEDLAQLHGTDGHEAEAFSRHVPFHRCPAAIKGLLASQLEPLLGRLIQELCQL